MSDQDPIVVDQPEHQQFEIAMGDDVAFAEYRLVAGGIMFTHTEVPASLEGRGLGKKLVLAGRQRATGA